MNRFLWFLVNLGLVTAVCGVGLLLTESDPAARWDQIRKDALADAQAKAPKPTATVKGELPAPDARDSVDANTLKVLWQRSLFRPDRTEDIEIKAANDKAKDAAPQAEWVFELKAILRMNERSVAIIQVDPAKRAPVRSTRSSRSTRRMVPTPPPAKGPAAKPKRAKRLFHEGDSVGETGFVVTKISKAEVILNKGDEEKILTIERQDAGSLARRAAQVKLAPKAKAGTPPAAPRMRTTSRSTHSQPPPPPGGPGGPGTPVPVAGSAVRLPNPKDTALAEKRKRLAEERKRLLEQYKRSANKN